MIGPSIANIAFDTFERVPWIAKTVTSLPIVGRLVNRLVIDAAASATAHRPLPFSLWTPGAAIGKADPCDHDVFTAWPGLVDRSFTGRHLGPMDREQVQNLPCIEEVVSLFERGRFRVSPKTTVLFCLFAQWFTDSFLRTHPSDRRKNTSNHEIDLCQIYGLGEEATGMLRAKSGGLLKCRTVDGGEFPDLLADPATLEVKDEFAGIAYDPASATTFNDTAPPHGTARDLRETIRAVEPWAVTNERWRHHYAAGLERGNSTLVYSALNTIFLREHNRLARALKRAKPLWDSCRLFETARCINIVLMLKVIIEDYINHLASVPIKISLEQGYADSRRWYRTNRMALEFNLLYRWHSMVPDHFELDGRRLPQREFRYNNELLEAVGVERVIDAASRQAAGEVSLRNTPDFLMEADRASIRFGRQFRLKGFNDYRVHWGMQPYRSFEELAGSDGELATRLEQLYPDRGHAKGIDRVELYVGLFAEQRRAGAVLPSLMKAMVASDAFSQALTNPLLATYVYGKECFTEVGIEAIERTSCLGDIVLRNLAIGAAAPAVRFTLAGPD